MSAKITPISNGAEGVFIENTRFNTTLVSFNFYMPLSRDTAAKYALLPFVLTSCGAKYPDFSSLNFKLAKLYGASLSASAEKVGDYQLLKLSISVIDDRFTLDNESLCDQALELLTSLVFEPKVENGAFCEIDLEREKRKAIEHVRGELSEKRVYAKGRLIEEMFKGDAYGTRKCGTEEDIQKITGEDLYNAWCDVLAHAFLRINVISKSNLGGLFDKVAEKIGEIKRENITDCTKTVPAKAINKVNTVTERMEVAQGKLVMGFSSELHGEQAFALSVMCDIFGGGPYSRLFTNVREKMSLCYYCSAASNKAKGLITVDSGVEAKNADTAQKEILNQLDAVKRGEFTDFEFDSSIKSIIDSLNSYYDSQRALDVWYSIKVTDGDTPSPEDTAKEVALVTRDDVIAAAAGVKLHTVFKLMPKEDESL